jgi:hypothetical protein
MASRLPAIAAAATALSALAAGTALAQGAATRASACTPSVRTVGGVQEKVFCGKAKATVKVGGKSFTISKGACIATPKYLTVNIGTLVLGHTTKPKADYFGLDVGRLPKTNTPTAGKDGTYTKTIFLAVNHGGVRYVVDTDFASGSVTLSGGRTRGTATGTTITGQVLTASFHC